MSEFDQLRAELRPGVPGLISFFPLVTGVGRVEATAATYTVHDIDGNQIDSGTATLTTLDGITRIDCPVTVNKIAEGYQCRITYRVAGESVDRLHVEAFDCVLWPWPETTVSYDDIVDERPDAIDILERLADRVGKTPVEYAAVIGYRARVALDGMLRDAIKTDEADNKFGQRFLRGSVVINRERFRRVEIKLALRELFASTMTGSADEDDPASALHGYYSREVDSAWRQVGRLTYSKDDDLTADEDIDQRLGADLELEVVW